MSSPITITGITGSNTTGGNTTGGKNGNITGNISAPIKNEVGSALQPVKPVKNSRKRIRLSEDLPEDAIVKCKPTTDQLEQVIDDLKRELQAKDIALKDATESFSTLEDDWNKVVEENDRLEENENQLKVDIETLRAEIKSAKNNVFLLNRQKMVEEKKTLQQQVNNLQVSLDKSNQTVEELQIIKEEYQAAVEMIADLEKRNQSLLSKVADLRDLQASLEAADIKWKAQELVNSGNSKKLETMQTEKLLALERLDSKNAELANVKAISEEMEKRCTDQLNIIQRLENQLSGLQDTRTTSTALQATILQQNDVMKELQDSIRKQDWSSFLRDLQNLCQKCYDCMNVDPADLSSKFETILEKITEMTFKIETIVPDCKIAQPDLWPDAMIRYYIHPNLQDRAQEIVTIMKEIENCTHVKLIPLSQPPEMASCMVIEAGTFSNDHLGSTNPLGYPGPVGVSHVLVNKSLEPLLFSLTLKHEIGYHAIFGVCHYHQTVTGSRLLKVLVQNDPINMNANKYSDYMEKIVQDIGYFPCFSVGCYSNAEGKIQHHNQCQFGVMANQTFGDLDGLVISGAYKKLIFKREYELKRMKGGSCQWASEMNL